MKTRKDGRNVQELRPLQISFDGLARTDGCARFGFSTTSALASVSGPIEVRLVSEHPSQASLEVLVRPLSNVSGTEAKSFASILRSLLTPSLLLSQNPRTLVQLVIQGLCSPRSSWKAGLYAAMINAATLALLNAGSIPMRGVVCAVSVAKLAVEGTDGVLVVDPSEDEEPHIQGGGCFAFMFGYGVGDGEVDCVWTTWSSKSAVGGMGDEFELSAAKDMAKNSTKEAWTAIKHSLHREYLSNKMQVGDGNQVVDDAKMEI